LQFGALEGTAKEASGIAPLLPGAKLLTGSQATENAVKQFKGSSILHIATHGFFLRDKPQALISNTNPISGAPPNSNTIRSENPLLRAGLALAGFNPRRSGSEDGVLTALEVAGLNLRGTKLVVLSACETGVGDVVNGEGIYGLRRALVIAGAESQVLSLWKVSDEGTKDLMVNYYQKLKANMGRSEALRQTQLEMLQSEKYRHPYFWAAFIASGNWKSVELK
jgi:CHAT domain-containing protein